MRFKIDLTYAASQKKMETNRLSYLVGPIINFQSSHTHTYLNLQELVGQTDRQTETHTDRRTDRQTDTEETEKQADEEL